MLLLPHACSFKLSPLIKCSHNLTIRNLYGYVFFQHLFKCSFKCTLKYICAHTFALTVFVDAYVPTHMIVDI